MTTENRPDAPLDAQLVAYLDGELSPAESVSIGQRIAVDPSLAARIEVLMKGARPFREAFAPLLRDAPSDRLDSILSKALDPKAPAPRRSRSLRRRAWLMAGAAALAFMLAGAGLDRLVITPIGSSLFLTATNDEGSEDWRLAIAQHLSLYTNDTLSIIPDTGTGKHQELASIGTRLGVDLTPARVELPDLTLKQVEMFAYDGRALGFLAYLDPHSGPVSLCIIADPDEDAPLKVERRGDMSVVYWSRAHHGFMLIGRIDVGHLKALATIVADRFGAGGKPAGDRG